MDPSQSKEVARALSKPMGKLAEGLHPQGLVWRDSGIPGFYGGAPEDAQPRAGAPPLLGCLGRHFPFLPLPGDQRPSQDRLGRASFVSTNTTVRALMGQAEAMGLLLNMRVIPAGACSGG